jgi:hypothetical protein
MIEFAILFMSRRVTSKRKRKPSAEAGKAQE